MKGKKAPILLVFFAGLAMFAQAVIPHHHHDLQICFNYSHCKNDIERHGHNSTEHNHDCGDSGSSCYLVQFRALPSDGQKQETYKLFHSNVKHSSSVDFQFTSNNNNCHGIFREIALIIPVPVNYQLQSEIFFKGDGLRAPPVV